MFYSQRCHILWVHVQNVLHILKVQLFHISVHVELLVSLNWWWLWMNRLIYQNKFCQWLCRFFQKFEDFSRLHLSLFQTGFFDWPIVEDSISLIWYSDNLLPATDLQDFPLNSHDLKLLHTYLQEDIVDLLAGCLYFYGLPKCF